MEKYRPNFDIKYDWIFLKLRRSTNGFNFFNIASNLTVASVGIFSKVLTNFLNKIVCYNHDRFSTIIWNKPEKVPLITVSNHHSCFDDPGIWGSLDFQHLCTPVKMRWSLAAHDICFSNIFHSYFFTLGKCVPIIRGKGVYQPAIDFCIERLLKGEWVHIFPEGRVNVNKEYIRLKWGVGRMIYELPVVPIIIPIWHIGMDEILPNKEPYMFRTRKLLTLNFGKPINISNIVIKLKTENVSPEIARKTITEKIQEELMALKTQTELLHKKNKLDYSNNKAQQYSKL